MESKKLNNLDLPPKPQRLRSAEQSTSHVAPLSIEGNNPNQQVVECGNVCKVLPDAAVSMKGKQNERIMRPRKRCKVKFMMQEQSSSKQLNSQILLDAPVSIGRKHNERMLETITPNKVNIVPKGRHSADQLISHAMVNVKGDTKTKPNQSKRVLDPKSLNNVNVKPRGRHSAKELVFHVTPDNKLSRGQKFNERIDPKEETKKLQIFYDSFRNQLSMPRIVRSGNISVAVWNEEKQLAQLVDMRNGHKIGLSGFTEDNKHYLEFFEALHLVEMGLIQLQYNSYVLSIEQAYLLLLGEQKTDKYNIFIAYSFLRKCGWQLFKFNNIRYNPPTKQKINESINECIWALLLNNLYKKPVAKNIQNSAIFIETAKRMESIKKNIIEQNSVPIEKDGASLINFSRKIPGIKNSWKKNKKWNKNQTTKSMPLLQNHEKMLLQTYERESKLKYNIIKMEQPKNSTREPCRDLIISFDVYQNLKRRAERELVPPISRIVVMHTTQAYPNHDEIAKCYQKQSFPVPLYFVFITESNRLLLHIYQISQKKNA